MSESEKTPEEALIAGYGTLGDRINLLVLASKENADFKYRGFADWGFEATDLQNKLTALLTPLSIPKSPLYEPTDLEAEIIWVKPVLVCEVKQEKAVGNILKHAEFLWLREDKNIHEHLDKLI